LFFGDQKTEGSEDGDDGVEEVFNLEEELELKEEEAENPFTGMDVID